MSKEVTLLDYGGKDWRLGTIKEVEPTGIWQHAITARLCDHEILEYDRLDFHRLI